ncbi:MAG: hydroxyacid dehydrogenase [Eubacteriales bacterium]|nr:hydroxyacid dehydrogenase [Eubacteriales bacterium]
MKRCVYSVIDEGERIRQLLEEQGYEFLQGDGKTIEEEKLARCDALIPGKCYVTEEVLQKAPRLQIVSKFGVGVDKIDIPACTRHNVWVSNTALTNYIAVAEHTIALMLAAAKKLYPVSCALHKQQPDWDRAKSYSSIELNGKTLSVIGLGNIGRRVASLAHAFDMKIVGYDPYADSRKAPAYITLAATLEDALAEADFVTLHVAGGESVRNMIDASKLAMMKREAILINTTRGFVVNEADLIDALSNHVIAGAALDVFETEPVREANPLLLMDNVIATPHNAANTPDARLRSQEQCVRNILCAMNGERPPFALNNPERGQKDA